MKTKPKRSTIAQKQRSKAVRQPQDATLRNIRAIKARVATLERLVKAILSDKIWKVSE